MHKREQEGHGDRSHAGPGPPRGAPRPRREQWAGRGPRWPSSPLVLSLPPPRSPRFSFILLLTCCRPWTGLFSKLPNVSKHCPVAFTFKREFDGNKIPGEQVFAPNSIQGFFYRLEKLSDMKRPTYKLHRLHDREPFFLTLKLVGILFHPVIFLSFLVPRMYSACSLCKFGSFFGSEDVPSIGSRVCFYSSSSGFPLSSLPPK